MRHEISNSDDILDSRDVIKRIDELQGERDDLEFMDNSVSEHDGKYIVGDDESITYDTEEQAIKAELEERQADWDESDEGEELKALKALQDEAEGYSDWIHGATLLRDSYMDEEWAKQELKDLGYIPDDLQYIIESNINWKGVLEDLQQDYTSVEWDGVTYWVRE